MRGKGKKFFSREKSFFPFPHAPYPFSKKAMNFFIYHKPFLIRRILAEGGKSSGLFNKHNKIYHTCYYLSKNQNTTFAIGIFFRNSQSILSGKNSVATYLPFSTTVQEICHCQNFPLCRQWPFRSAPSHDVWNNIRWRRFSEQHKNKHQSSQTSLKGTSNHRTLPQHSIRLEFLSIARVICWHCLFGI